MPTWFRNPGRSQAFWMFALCGFAALRIAFYCSAFPFFTNVDEPLHFDLIWKYSRGQWPSNGSDRIHPEAERHIAYFASPEYLFRPGDFQEARYPAPIWTLPENEQRKVLSVLSLRRGFNHEEHSPPLYYVLAGAWLRLGETAGLKEAALLYWTRLMNVPVYLGLMGLSLYAGRRLFRERPELSWSLPVLVAFFPQDVFYSFNSDVLTPIPCTIAFLLACRLAGPAGSGAFAYAALGAALAAALLVKLANAPILVWLAAPLPVLWQAVRGNAPGRTMLINAGALAACLLGPLALWGMRNQALLGEWTGTRHKIEYLGWSYKSIADVLPHPIASPAGLSYFFDNLFASFWRGEFTWGLERIALAGVDAFYALSTIILLGTAAFYSVRGWRETSENRFIALGLAGVAAALAYLVFLSMIFDFHECFYPSRRLPFFVSGRLLLCVMIPILIAYAAGLEKLFGIFAMRRYAVHALVLTGICVTLVEFFLNLPAFGSPYNLWNLPAGSLFR